MQESGRETENINRKDGKSPENAERCIGTCKITSCPDTTEIPLVCSIDTHPPASTEPLFFYYQ
jgi:hypothetical protein